MTRDACAHCGLPVGRRPVAGVVDGVPGRFCCYGCLLALQVTRARGEPGAAAAVLVRLGLASFFAMNVMMVSLPAYAPYVYGERADGPLFTVLRVLAMILAAPVLLLLGGPILASAWRGLRAGGANADALIVLGTVAAYALSAVNALAGRPEVYFDTAAMLLVLVTLGRYLEARARAEAGAAVTATLAPAPAAALRLRGGEREAVSPAVLVTSDVVQVGPGEAFPTDGVVMSGTGGVDEAVLTGEGLPVVKEPGAAVAGGTCSVDGLFRVRVTARAADSAAARIAALLADARRQPSAAERTADQVAHWLVPAVVLVAAMAGGWWTAVEGLERGVLTALAVLVVACPCALGIATPVAVWHGLVAAARRGVIVRSAAALERAAAVVHVVFDKTGTLTDGAPRLVAVEPAAGSALSPDALLALAAALEEGLTHPLAVAVTEAARTRRLALPAAEDIRAIPGRGVRGRIGGEPVVVGSAGLAAEEVLGTAAPVAAVGIVAGGRFEGTLSFAEAPRATAAAAVAALRRLGLRPAIVSGDTRADALVPRLFAPEEAALGLLPEEKVARVRALRAGGAVAMVGDGINDAPALAAADLGVAVATATDLARLAADAIVLTADLRAVPWLIAHARRVRRVIRQNLAWAFGYNLGAVGLAVAGMLNPIAASLAMLASSLAVVANAGRLARAAKASAPAARAAVPHGEETGARAA